jgi:hypothetical protein
VISGSLRAVFTVYNCLTRWWILSHEAMEAILGSRVRWLELLMEVTLGVGVVNEPAKSVWRSNTDIRRL